MNQLKQVVFEIEERVVLRSGELRAMHLCPACQTVTEMATPWIAATLNGSTERELFRLIELGLIHSVEDKRILICLNCVRKTVSAIAETVLIKPIESLNKPKKA